MKTQLIYLLRHGRTKANYDDIYQGKKIDFPLDETGVMQAQKLGQYLLQHGHEIKQIYSSPAKRAMETSTIVAHILSSRGTKDPEGNLEPVMFVNRDLNEIDHGEWDGKTPAEVKVIWPKIVKNWWYGDQEKVRFPGGESIKAARRRILSAVKFILRDQYENIAIVAHGGVNSIWLANLLDSKSFRPIRQFNTCINIIERSIEGRRQDFNISLINGTEHLL